MQNGECKKARSTRILHFTFLILHYENPYPEVDDGLALARVPASAGLTAIDYRGIYLDAAAPAAVCGALLQPEFGARGADTAVTPAAPPSVCPVPARAG